MTPPTVEPKQKPEIKIETVINSNTPGRLGAANPREYDSATVNADKIDVKASRRVFKFFNPSPELYT